MRVTGLNPIQFTGKLSKGSKIPIVLDQDISSKTAQEGDTIIFTVRKDVKAEDNKKEVMIEKGTQLTARIAEIRDRGYWGKPAEVLLEFNYIKASDGDYIPLHSREHIEGSKRRPFRWGLTGVFLFLIPPLNFLFLLPEGDHAEVKDGKLKLDVLTARDFETQ